jgi:aromatic ring-opening dioxygenase catalytic subunit (LigB family)
LKEFTMSSRLPTYFISHGGGPWPWMEDMAPAMQVLRQSLADIPRQLGQTPKAVLMVTAHWEGRAFTLGTAARPGMVYDYGGFPAHTYEVVYPAPGAPELALRVQGLLEAAGLPVAQDAGRGYDHGTFVPLAVMFPGAEVPVLQMSLRAGLDPAEHLALGRALAPLRDEGVLIVGSGLSYHNLRQFGRAGQAPSQAFDAWLQTAMAAAPATRTQALLDWEQAPSARICHPREEHLLPLMVAVGAAEADTASCVYHEEHVFGGVTASSFRLDAVPA